MDIRNIDVANSANDTVFCRAASTWHEQRQIHPREFFSAANGKRLLAIAMQDSEFLPPIDKKDEKNPDKNQQNHAAGMVKDNYLLSLSARELYVGMVKSGAYDAAQDVFGLLREAAQPQSNREKTRKARRILTELANVSPAFADRMKAFASSDESPAFRRMATEILGPEPRAIEEPVANPACAGQEDCALAPAAPASARSQTIRIDQAVPA